MIPMIPMNFPWDTYEFPMGLYNGVNVRSYLELALVDIPLPRKTNSHHLEKGSMDF